MSYSTVKLVGMGNPLLDISAEVPEEILTKYGVTLNNAILAEEKHVPVYKDLVDNFQVQFIAGGATLNSVRVAQWMLKAPQSTGYFGCVGKDDYAKTMNECATSDGVVMHFQENEETPTGTCAVLVNGGERSLIANLAAANKFTPDHLKTDKATGLISAAEIYYVAGFFMTVSVESILEVAKHANDNYKTFCMNLSAPFLMQFFGEQFNLVLPFTDFIFGNESEAAALGEAKGWGSDLKEIALKLAAMPKASGTRSRVVVFTQGSESTLVASNGKVEVYAVDPLPKEQLVDTNGAGDAFVGGFLAKLVGGKGMEECVLAGHWAARTIIQRSGCTFPAVCDYEG